MLRARRMAVLVCLMALAMSNTGCFWHKVVYQRGNAPKGVTVALYSATAEQLVQKLHKIYDGTHTFNATVDMTPETGSVYKGEITEYKDLKAYILFRAPQDIRIIGLAPVVRSKIFDMVSDGQNFRISLPTKTRFVEGRNDAPPASKNSLENLRPEVFLRAMLVRPPDEALETPILFDSTDEQNAQYVLALVGKDANGKLVPRRTVFFDRTDKDLNILRQREYDTTGAIVSDTRYQGWKFYKGGIRFPSQTTITRPTDGYGVSMTIVKLEGNSRIGDEKFVLNKPEAAQLVTIGSAIAAPAVPSK